MHQLFAQLHAAAATQAAPNRARSIGVEAALALCLCMTACSPAACILCFAHTVAVVVPQHVFVPLRGLRAHRRSSRGAPVRRLSWTLTAQLSTLVHGIIGRPSTLIDLADEANPLLRDFVHLAELERLPAFPQVLIADHIETSGLVPLTLYINGLSGYMPSVLVAG
jgi:hypothetical protein